MSLILANFKDQKKFCDNLNYRSDNFDNFNFLFSLHHYENMF